MTTVVHKILLASAFVVLLVPSPVRAQWLLAEGLDGGSGSTLGPDGALYVTERLAGRITRVDPGSGEMTTFAENLPIPVIDLGVGGASDVAFVDGVAYALVTVVGPAFDALAPVLGLPPGFGGTDIVGIYRIDGPDNPVPIADIGAWSVANEPATSFFLDHGVQYALEPFRGGLLVSDGHHNRVLWVSLEGHIHEMNAFGNIVPTGLEVHGKTILMAEAGPIPHLPADGKVVAFEPKILQPVEIASGGRLLVDVEFGLGRRLYALAQGEWCPPGESPPQCGKMDGAPAEPNGGSLLEVNADGTFTEIVFGLNLPTSMEFIGNSAYIVNLLGEIWVVDDVSDPPFGKQH